MRGISGSCCVESGIASAGVPTLGGVGDGEDIVVVVCSCNVSEGRLRIDELAMARLRIVIRTEQGFKTWSAKGRSE